MFSARVPPLGSNRVSRVVARLVAAGRPPLDLTTSNPTTVGLTYPPDLLASLDHPDGLVYRPHPRGHLEARRAVAEDLATRGVEASPERIVLTASTSESYAALFKLLCDPGDLALVPQPSYPLFDHLTRLEGVVSSAYRLEYYGQWRVDLDSVERRLEPRVRALLMVNPNNPTGSWVAADEVARIRELALRQDVALVSDEVFDRYAWEPAGAERSGALVNDAELLTFTLGGLSKAVGLPQLKLGWMVVGGPDRLVKPALDRLDFICDSFLSVSTPVQLAAARLIEKGRPVADQIQARVRDNLGELDEAVARYPAVQRLRAEGGWYAVLQVPTLGSEEALVIRLLEEDGVLVHPGYFYDFPRASFLILSLLPSLAEFRDATARILSRVSG